MEKVFRIAFWTLALSGILRAQSAALMKAKITGLKRDLHFIPDHVKCPLNMSLYTPTHKVKCLTAALECITKELETAKEECEDNSLKIDQVLNDLYEIGDKPISGGALSQSNSTECVCERWPSSPWQNFLDNISSLLELYTLAHMEAASS